MLMLLLSPLSCSAMLRFLNADLGKFRLGRLQLRAMGIDPFSPEQRSQLELSPDNIFISCPSSSSVAAFRTARERGRVEFLIDSKLFCKSPGLLNQLRSHAKFRDFIVPLDRLVNQYYLSAPGRWEWFQAVINPKTAPTTVLTPPLLLHATALLVRHVQEVAPDCEAVAIPPHQALALKQEWQSMQTWDPAFVLLKARHEKTAAPLGRIVFFGDSVAQSIGALSLQIFDHLAGCLIAGGLQPLNRDTFKVAAQGGRKVPFSFDFLPSNDAEFFKLVPEKLLPSLKSDFVKTQHSALHSQAVAVFHEKPTTLVIHDIHTFNGMKDYSQMVLKSMERFSLLCNSVPSIETIVLLVPGVNPLWTSEALRLKSLMAQFFKKTILVFDWGRFLCPHGPDREDKMPTAQQDCPPAVYGWNPLLPDTVHPVGAGGEWLVAQLFKVFMTLLPEFSNLHHNANLTHCVEASYPIDNGGKNTEFTAIEQLTKFLL